MADDIRCCPKIREGGRKLKWREHWIRLHALLLGSQCNQVLCSVSYKQTKSSLKQLKTLFQGLVKGLLPFSALAYLCCHQQRAMVCTKAPANLEKAVLGSQCNLTWYLMWPLSYYWLPYSCLWCAACLQPRTSSFLWVLTRFVVYCLKRYIFTLVRVLLFWISLLISRFPSLIMLSHIFPNTCLFLQIWNISFQCTLAAPDPK